MTLELFIELNIETNLHEVVLYRSDNDTTNWWGIFQGTESECEYFKDNLAKGFKFLGITKD